MGTSALPAVTFQMCSPTDSNLIRDGRHTQFGKARTGDAIPAVPVDLMQTPRLHYLGDHDQHEAKQKPDHCAPDIERAHSPPQAKRPDPLAIQEAPNRAIRISHSASTFLVLLGLERRPSLHPPDSFVHVALVRLH